MKHPWITPEWAVHDNVRALVTTRAGGVSSGEYGSMNIGASCGDEPALVHRNRAILRAHLPSDVRWLRQVHGTGVADLDHAQGDLIADAALSRTPGRVVCIQTADCLPVLFADDAATVVAAAHAGWRGLAAGVLEATVTAMKVTPGSIAAYFGPAISQGAFEVGPEVRDLFVAVDPQAEAAFVAGKPGKYHADLYALARQRLSALGVTRVFGGGRCTFNERDTFFSYRRAAKSGRMASAIWLAGVSAP